MGDARENEHQAQRIPRGRLPRAKSGDACETESPKNETGQDEN
jgi:hypothetical protein